MGPNDADGIANSLGAVWSGFALFAQTYLSENLGSLRYLRYLNKLLERLVIQWKSILNTYLL